MSNGSPTLVNHALIKRTREMEVRHNFNFKYLPDYANFLLQYKLSAFAQQQLNFSRALNLPLLKYFKEFSEEEIIQLGIKESRVLLTSLAGNKAREFIEQSLKRWQDDQLPMISRDQIILEDVALLNLIRRKAFGVLISQYTSDVNVLISIMSEVDEFTVAQDTISYQKLFSLQQSLYREAQALSGVGNWVWDLKTNTIIWSEELYRIYGLEPDAEVNYDKLYTFNHPDDAEKVRKEMAYSIESGIPHDFIYRIILRDGVQKIVRAKGEVKKDSNGQSHRLFGTLQDVTADHLLKKQLEEGKSFAELMIDSSEDIISAYDNEQNITAWNKKCEEVYRLKKEDVMGKHILDVFSPSKGASPIDDVRQALLGKKVHHLERKYDLTKQGYFETFHIPLKNNRGDIFGALTVSHDITDLKNQANALQEINLSFDQAEKIASISHWQMNLSTGKITFSDNLYRLLGAAPRSFDASLESYLTYIHPDDRHLIFHNGQVVVKQNNSLPELCRVLRKDGALRFFQAIQKLMVNQFGEKVIIGINRDITEEHLLSLQLKKANEAIRRSDERYHRMVEEIEDYSIILLDTEGYILNWNKGAQKIKGYSADEIVGKHFSIFYTTDDVNSKRPDTVIQQAKVRGRANDEGWRVRKDGSKFWGNVLMTVLHDEHNNIIGFAKITRDLTERKRSEDRLLQYANSIEQKNEQLEISNTELASFTYIASHDLREPLRKIKIFTNRIEERESLSEPGKDYFRRIVWAADRMQNMIDALLSYSRITTADLEKEIIDLNLILKEVKDNLSEDLAEKQATIESDILPSLNVVTFQIQQLFINLISNALKYSKPDVPPRIKISVMLIPGSQLPMASKDVDFYKISFQDNGIGFEQMYGERIFELFQRLHNRNEFEGTGIGLAICKKIVQNHDGVINATSEPGQGSTFNVFLPSTTFEVS
jgi:PAS domain S-box-containing protein